MPAANTLESARSKYNKIVSCKDIANPIIKTVYTKRNGDRAYNTSCPAHSACAHKLSNHITINESETLWYCERIGKLLTPLDLACIKYAVVSCKSLREGKLNPDELKAMKDIARRQVV